MAREAALQVLYGLDAAGALEGAAVEAALEDYWAHLEGPAPGKTYGDQLVRGVVQERASLDQAIREANPAWRVERMARVDRNVVRIAAWELLHGGVEVPIAIDEAIELARRFGGEDSPAFVNGTLDKLASLRRRA